MRLIRGKNVKDPEDQVLWQEPVCLVSSDARKLFDWLVGLPDAAEPCSYKRKATGRLGVVDAARVDAVVKRRCKTSC